MSEPTKTTSEQPFPAVAPKEKLWNSNYLKVWLANFMLFFSFMLLTPLLPLYLSDTYGADKQTIGLVLSGYTLMALMMRPFSGFMVDSFPRKKVLLLCYGCFALLFAGYLLAGTLLLFTILRTFHGAPFGATTVANSTVAIDTLPSSRRNEGIGYYGLSNNIATAIGPSVALFLFHGTGNYDVLFALALVCSLIGFGIDFTVKLPERPLNREARRLSTDRFFLTNAWTEGLNILCFAFSYGVLSTYLAIYGKEELDITGGTGLFFALLAIGLILSRLTGTRSLGKGLVSRNAAMGILVSLFGYLLFAALHNRLGYYGAALIIGLGNGHMYPAFQTMFINLAPHTKRGTANSTLLTSWDVGVGVGVLLGGVLSEHFGYHSAFWMAWVVNGAGALLFFCRTRRHFECNKLR